MSISTRIKTHLEENKIPYTPVTHSSSFTAQGAAAVMHVSGKELAKTVVLASGDKTLIAVLPATYHVSLEKLSNVVGRPVRLATELEFASLFPDCEVGAMPPLGEIYGLPVYMDESLIADKEITFNAGTHKDALRMSLSDFMRVAQPTMCSIAAKG
jgi:Ala-tRNA(Pro) deacylase